MSNGSADSASRGIMSAPRVKNMRSPSPRKAWLRALEATAPIERGEVPILPLLVNTLAERFDAAPALLAKDSSLSYRELAQAVNRYARWALTEGLSSGDVVCLLMHNSPDYMPIWLGLSRIGVTVALINTNLTGGPLTHVINAVAARGIIAGAPLCPAVRAIRACVRGTCWAHGPDDPELPRVDLAAAPLPGEPLTRSEHPEPSLADRALYIYTSGPTGLPKAASVSHFRLLQWSHWFAGLMDTGSSDRMYNCLPMYHSIGAFWQDVVKERCTLFQYIGELSRYLVASPPQLEETLHALRLCCGNGLRADIWQKFKSRFRIPQILEYYAATEGTFSLYNCEERVGAIGKIPAFLQHRVPVALVKFDTESDTPLRDATGRCLRCAPNDVGEAIGAVSQTSGEPGGRFEGYADPEVSKKKILRNVFAEGDSWFRTGDLMRQDDQGFFYFVDRVGDTFRWKGENVSTSEVAAVISACPGVAEATVYGVELPGTEGRAGMAAVVTRAPFDLETFRRHVAALPGYARPLFLRIVPSIQLTDTFRLKKHELAAQGYDPTLITDELYFDDPELRRYIPLDAILHERIRTGDLWL